MKTIAIAGAKPGIRLPKADAVYAANAAFLTNPSAFQQNKDLTVVASSLVVSKGLLGCSKNAQIYRKKSEAIRDVKAQRVVLLEDPTDREKSSRMPEILQQANPKRSITIISGKERRRLIREVSKGHYPIVGMWSLKQPARVLTSDLRKLLRSLFNWSLGSGNYDVPGRYRPSTGIMALLIAISEHESKANYVLAGIGLKDRDVYQFADGSKGKMRRRGRGLPAHVMADIEIIKRVAKHVNLTTTEPDLADLLHQYEGPIIE